MTPPAAAPPRRILPTLQKRHAPLASTAEQRAVLARVPLGRSFRAALEDSGLYPLRATGIEIFQVNVGRRCNQTCRHCHVDAGPERTEVMPDAVLDRCLEIIESTDIPTVDVTGGAPELHPRWRELVTRGRAAGREVIDRCNLTITLLPNYAYLPGFLAEQGVHVIASLPHFRQKGTDTQRGEGVFEESIEALRRFNALGYGRPGSGLVLDLVTNPVGTFLPGSQKALEAEWRRQLQRLHGVEFNSLYTITNMPISRFLEFLEESGQTREYLERLANAYNPAAAAGVMCRTTLSVAWDGTLHDCDFNQMLDLPVARGVPRTVFDFDLGALARREIVLGPHCFGCTAGAGSSCGGATVS
ncbi:MAG TPA: arsenosugar biosynthesis radical SAM (seleno)protein ArsS [Longimicrobiaceae bacterium]|nr:arsenosugar biosynthesis radical SAM (seleno)protein ArsS [Longimicrobiaceae bacterium]